jgi:hypothetical protein
VADTVRSPLSVLTIGAGGFVASWSTAAAVSIDIGGHTGSRVVDEPTGATATAWAEELHQVSVVTWGLDPDTATAVARQVRAAGSTLTVADPPFGLRDVDPTAAPPDRDTVVDPAGFESDSQYLGTSGEAISLSIDRTASRLDDLVQAEVGTLLTSGGQPWDVSAARSTIRAVSVRGTTGVARVATLSGGHRVADVVWVEPQHAAVVSMRVDDVSTDDRLQAILDSIVPVDDATWEQLVANCPGPVANLDPATGGTAPPNRPGPLRIVHC